MPWDTHFLPFLRLPSAWTLMQGGVAADTVQTTRQCDGVWVGRCMGRPLTHASIWNTSCAFSTPNLLSVLLLSQSEHTVPPWWHGRRQQTSAVVLVTLLIVIALEQPFQTSSCKSMQLLRVCVNIQGRRRDIWSNKWGKKKTYCLSEHYDFPGIKAFVHWLCSNWAQQKYSVCCCPSICLPFYLSANGPNVYSLAELPLNKTLR